MEPPPNRVFSAWCPGGPLPARRIRFSSETSSNDRRQESRTARRQGPQCSRAAARHPPLFRSHPLPQAAKTSRSGRSPRRRSSGMPANDASQGLPACRPSAPCPLPRHVPRPPRKPLMIRHVPRTTRRVPARGRKHSRNPQCSEALRHGVFRPAHPGAICRRHIRSRRYTPGGRPAQGIPLRTARRIPAPLIRHVPGTQCRVRPKGRVHFPSGSDHDGDASLSP